MPRGNKKLNMQVGKGEGSSQTTVIKMNKEEFTKEEKL